jgi:RNA polymerase sigma-70 factor (ECF subfamily)
LGKPIPFATIYRGYFRQVSRSVRRFGVAERHADDVTQDVFVAVHRGLPRFDWSQPLLPWLRTITYRVARDHREAGKNREELSFTEGFDPADTASEDHEGRLTGKRDALKDLDAILQTLDDDEREMILLCDVDECRVIDVARALGLRDSTVSTRLQRARKRFDAALSRRRAAEERRLGAACVLPLFLLDPAMLWDAARVVPEVSAAVQARIWSRLLRATATNRVARALSVLSALTPAQILGGALLATTLGAVAGGAAVHARLRRTDNATIPAERGESPAVAAEQAPPSRPVSATTAAPTATTSPASAKGAGDLDAGTTAHAGTGRAGSEREERVLIDRARNALRTDHQAEALDVLARHARKFPQGVYQEERESLRAEARRSLAETDREKL